MTQTTPANDSRVEERLDFPFAPPSALEAPAEWARLRSGCPVAKVRASNGIEGMVLTTYDDVRALLADPRFERGPLSGDPSGAGGEDFPGFDVTVGDRHPHWRRILGRTFTVKRVRAMQPAIERVAHGLVDDMIASTPEGGSADLLASLGFPLPVYVICDLLGVPVKDVDRFSAWSDRMFNFNLYSKDEVVTAYHELYGYIQGHVRTRRHDPGDDLLSVLVAGSETPEGELTEDELVSTGMALLTAGHETTASMIGKMVLMLLERRERWERLLDDRSLVPSAVEECLRFDTNLGPGMSRHVDQEIEVSGTTIPPRTTVWSVLGSANRDENVFDQADEMVLDRSPNPHMTFGVGAHSCPGQALARIELRTVLSVLLERLPGLELAIPAHEFQRREGLVAGGLEAVPVRW